MMIIDGETVITGPFNFTKAAEENHAENLLVIRNKKLAERYIRNWQKHAQLSRPMSGEVEKVEFEATKDRKDSQPIIARMVR